MAGPGPSGLEVLLSTLQDASDSESTLNILNVLDELLSAGTDRRIHYMIKKGGSEALLRTLVNTGCSPSPSSSILVPLLHLLTKVGHRDKKIGHKAEKAGAVLLLLDLLRQSLSDVKMAVACLWLLRVYASCVSTAALLGKNGALEVQFKLIAPHTKKNTRMVKAAIDALAALLNSKWNCRRAVSQGYVSSLLNLYEDWHSNDAENKHIPIRRALLHCLRHLTNLPAGRRALEQDGGMEILFRTTQACLASRGLESLAKSVTQIMRKCYPKQPLPLRSDRSTYSFPLPGCPTLNPESAPTSEADNLEEESDEEDAEIDDLDREEDDDLETDLTKLRTRPEPDRPLEELGQYARLCPELHYDFQDLDSDPDGEESSDGDGFLYGDAGPGPRFFSGGRREDQRSPRSKPVSENQGDPEGEGSGPRQAGSSGGPEPQLNPRDFHSQYLSSGTAGHEVSSMIKCLLEKHRGCIPGHDPRVYTSTAANTKSIAGYSVLAFPDFWGHLPPPYRQPMAQRRQGVQRSKVFEDIQRLLSPADVVDKVVFDLEAPSSQDTVEDSDSLRFYSKFESGNLRKAIQVRSYEYDVILNSDVNCSHYHHWFYFEVSGMKAGVPYRFNIINCEKANTQFNYGMQPVLYSVREALEGNPHWVRAGSDICYYKNHFSQSSLPGRGQKGRTYYTLTFSVTFQHSEDVCYLAYHYPYTYSALQMQLQCLQRTLDPLKVFFQQQTLCETLAGNPCPIITITAQPPSRSWNHLHQFRNRPCVLLTARVHPGESNASWVMKGTLEFLCSSHPVAESLRDAYIFKIIPMLNPDGVINGMHRCSLSGEDLNRQWMKPDLKLSPTIYHTKGFLYYLNSIGRTPLVFCDYHGHSRKKNVFLYGCSIKETFWQSGSTVNTVALKEDPGYRTLPKILDKIAPAFAFQSCSFLVEKSRASTARVVVWREMGVVRSYTMESTYCGCDQGLYKGLQIGTQELEEMGSKLCQGLLALKRNSLLYSKLIIPAPAPGELSDNRLDHKPNSVFDDDEPPCEEEIEYHSDVCSEHGVDSTELDAEVNGGVSDSEEDPPQYGLKTPDRKSRLTAQLPWKPSVEVVAVTLSSHKGFNSSNSHCLDSDLSHVE
ncbi:cytosolic carboxypeptidase 4-like isoform X1 [Acipenser ruthenus]|uniref:cytosolic carboxypeptidase 4-like isoform X1 n=1 Tax=Acipenser ruthenus TaxID=7906 RepID=UPI002741027A|nr:cytosolic carboxypeptidase 4-like isoform X1 [Acipenser ruthenus]